MYRVKENKNGSYDVFDSSTGNLVMVITNNKENGGRLNRRETTLPSNPALSKPIQLLTSDNGYRFDEFKRNGLWSPSVSLPTIRICDPPKPRRFSKRINAIQDGSSITQDCSVVLTRELTMEELGDKDEQYDCIDQDSFMTFFGLASTKEPVQSVVSLQRFLQRSTFVPPTYSRSNVFDVDLCSNLGQTMVANSLAVYAAGEAPSSTLAKYEMYCQASSRRFGNWDVPIKHGSGNYPVTYAPKSQWRHARLYSFSRRQRLERFKRLETGLTKRSRWLLKLCRNINVTLDRLTDDDISSKCLVSLDSLVENTTSSVIVSFGSGLSTSNCSESPSADSTIVIEIDELGSETVKVSHKPSKMINQHTGNPWLSPHSLSASGNLSQSASKPRHCRVILDDVQKSPQRNTTITGSFSRVGDRMSGNDVSESDSDVEIIGTYPPVITTNSCKRSRRVPPNAVNCRLLDRRDRLPSGTNNSIDPLDFVATTYDASPQKIAFCVKRPATSNKEQKDIKTRMQLRNSSLGNSDSSREHAKSRHMQTAFAKILSKFPSTNKMSVTRRAGRIEDPPKPILTPMNMVSDDEIVEVSRHNARHRTTQQIELDMISRLVFLSRSTSTGGDSAIKRHATMRHSEVSCVFKCHVCKCEELFKKNAVNSVYQHMVKHGGLSCTSLVSNLEEFEGYEVAILQAFPMTQ